MIQDKNQPTGYRAQEVLPTAEDSKAIRGGDILDLLVRAGQILFSDVLATGMSGSQQGTGLRRSSRLERKQGDTKTPGPSGTLWKEQGRTTDMLEGDIIVLSVEEPSPTSRNPEDSAGSAVPQRGEGSGEESEEGESPESPMVPSTRLKYSRY